MIYASANPGTLLAQHRRLLTLAAGLERIAAGPLPSSLEELWALRWSFSRDMLLHFAHVQRAVLDPLMQDARADVACAAMRSSADLQSVFEQFTRHVDRWKTMPLADNWDYYAKAIALLMRRLRVRLAAQETALYPCLPARPGGRAITVPAAIDYALEADAIRRQIFAHAERSRIAAESDEATRIALRLG